MGWSLILTTRGYLVMKKRLCSWSSSIISIFKDVVN